MTLIVGLLGYACIGFVVMTAFLRWFSDDIDDKGRVIIGITLLLGGWPFAVCIFLIERFVRVIHAYMKWIDTTK